VTRADMLYHDKDCITCSRLLLSPILTNLSNTEKGTVYILSMYDNDSWLLTVSDDDSCNSNSSDPHALAVPHQCPPVLAMLHQLCSSYLAWYIVDMSSYIT